MNERALRSIVVLGGGTVALSAAAAFARALPQTRVRLIETAIDPGALADRLPGTLPSVHRFHAAIGLSERDLVRAGAASHRLATRFESWPEKAAPWLLGFGPHGAPLGSIPFFQLWARARDAGRRVEPYHRYSAAALLAAAGAFAPPSDDPGSPLSRLDYALKLYPERTRAVLRQVCDALRVARAPGAVAGVERDDRGGIATLRLDGGEAVQADLFVDASGPAARLAEAVAPAWEEWGDNLRCDRVVIADATAPYDPTPLDLVRADTTGWRALIRLPDRSITVTAWASGLRERGDPADAVPLRSGRRVTPWQANVLALGDAAMQVAPLHQTNLAMAHSGILRALELLPGRDMHPLETGEYNRRAAQEGVRLRDFLALHDAFSPYRAACGPLPESLAETLRRFRNRARLPFFEEESFDRDAWAAALIGLGQGPDAVEPLAQGIDPAAAEGWLQRIAAALAAATRGVPPYRQSLTGA